MKGSYFTFLVVPLIFLLFTGCNRPEEETLAAEQEETLKTDSSSEEIDPFFSSPQLDILKDIEVKKDSSGVELNIPAGFLGPVTQEDVKQAASDADYPYGALNEDGSVTFRMSQDQHQELINGMADYINEALEDMIVSEEYPTFTTIQTNTDFTEFIITTSSKKLEKADSFSAMTLCMYGNLYAAFCGRTAQNVHVEYINEDSGQVIAAFDSSNADENE